jgi:hypothetical protein
MPPIKFALWLDAAVVLLACGAWLHFSGRLNLSLGLSGIFFLFGSVFGTGFTSIMDKVNAWQRRKRLNPRKPFRP